MRKSELLNVLPAFVLLFFLVPQTAYAQFFRATPASEALNKDRSYTLPIDDIHRYVNGQKGVFPVTLAFADTLTWEMEVEQIDVRGETYRFATATGEVLNTSASPVVTYRGKLSDDPESRVRMTVTDGYFRAFVSTSADDAYYIDMADSPSTVTLSQEEDVEALAQCGSDVDHQLHIHEKTNDAPEMVHSSLPPYEAEIAFVVDRLGAAPFDTYEELELELLTVLNYTDASYEVHQLTYKLTDILVYETEQSQPWNESSDAGRMLENFTSWAGGNTPLQQHDVATLWSGIDFGQTVGIAWIGAIGTSYRQNVVNFKKGSDLRNANIHAHELGHNWGSDHVNNGGWMMSAFLSSGSEPLPWNPGTINAFPGFIENAMQHLDDVGDGDDGGSQILSVDYGQLTITGDENGSGLLDPGETGNVNLVIENVDADPISNLMVTMTQDNNRAINHVTINSDPVVIETVEANGAATVSFNVTLSLLAPVDRSYRFLFALTDGTRTDETTLSFTSGDELLPVELTSFTAFESAGGVVLEWATAVELNNAGFEVEIQETGGAFRRVGFVEGAGTTLEAQTYRYRVLAVSPGSYGFRLKQIDFDGGFEYSDVVTLTVLPDVYTLKQNYPNPFNPQTRIEFQMPSAGDVSLEVFDMLGRRVALLVNGYLQAGEHVARFDGGHLPNGTYMYRLVAGDYEESKTMILLK